MPVDLTDLLENVSAPPMHVDVDTVLSRGRRRRLRRRLYGTAAVLGAAALILPAAAALRGDSAPSPVAAISPPGDCLFASPDPGGPPAGAFASLELTGTPWLDSGSSDAGRSVRVQVNTDTCQGLAVMVRRGSGEGCPRLTPRDGSSMRSGLSIPSVVGWIALGRCYLSRAWLWFCFLKDSRSAVSQRAQKQSHRKAAPRT